MLCFLLGKYRYFTCMIKIVFCFALMVPMSLQKNLVRKLYLVHLSNLDKSITENTQLILSFIEYAILVRPIFGYSISK